MLKEEWRTIEWAHNYKVSNYGRLKRVNHVTQSQSFGNKSIKHYPERLITKFTLSGGNKAGRYYYIALVGDNGKVRRIALHRLVAETWIPNPDNKPDVDHINKNTLDNRVSNLRWVTENENLKGKVYRRRSV